MNTNITLKLDYMKNEVVSAQRLRFLNSSRLKTIIALGLFTMIVLSASQIWAWLESGVKLPLWWFWPILVFLIFGGVFVVSYAFAPSIDFRINPEWHYVYDLLLRDDIFQITLSGQSKGVEMPWNKIKRVLENKKVYILFWGSDEEFFILPKRVLQTQIDFFHTKLNRDVVQSWRVSK